MNPVIQKLIDARRLAQIAKSTPEPTTPTIPCTPRVKKVLALAVKEAKHRNFNYVGTEHLLVGLLREGEGLAADYLKAMGVTLEDCLSMLDAVAQEAKLPIMMKSPMSIFEAMKGT